jgi:hypothetical protein
VVWRWHAQLNASETQAHQSIGGYWRCGQGFDPRTTTDALAAAIAGSGGSSNCRMVKPQHFAENRGDGGAILFLQCAGFSAIFNGANSPYGTSLNDSFSGPTRHVIPQHLAVYITLGRIEMVAFFKRLISRQPAANPHPARGNAKSSSPIAVEFDDWGIRTSLHGQPQGKVAWSEITLIAIRIEDEFLPFPYWYVGGKENLLRIPNDANGAKELFFDGLSEKVPGYKSDKTFRTIVEASGAMEGTFILWKSADAAD